MKTLLPQHSRDWIDVSRELKSAKSGDIRWKEGRTPLYVYYRDEELLQHQCEAFAAYMGENMHGSKTVFPSQARFETEVCEMSLGLFNAPSGAAASFTSGGTESLFLAVKSARDWARAHRPEIRRAKVVIPISSHPAFNKAAHYLDMDVVRVPLASDYRADVGAIAEAIDERTVMISGAAPAYPHGVFDPIGELAALAAKHEIWMHVDACYGGFLSPFARELGYPIPPFDFGVDGVWSLSADLHKHGFAPKGASIIAYRDAALMEFQGFEFSAWPRGRYFSPTFGGSRPAGAVAAAWALMQHLGRDGYLDLARRTMGARDRLIAGVMKIPGLTCLRPSELSILVIVSNEAKIDMNIVADELNRRGWFASRSSDPKGLHFTINPVHEKIVDVYLKDLAEAAQVARSGTRVAEEVGSTY